MRAPRTRTWHENEQLLPLTGDAGEDDSHGPETSAKERPHQALTYCILQNRTAWSGSLHDRLPKKLQIKRRTSGTPEAKCILKYISNEKNPDHLKAELWEHDQEINSYGEIEVWLSAGKGFTHQK